MRNCPAVAAARVSHVIDNVFVAFHLPVFSTFYQLGLGCDEVEEYVGLKRIILKTVPTKTMAMRDAMEAVDRYLGMICYINKVSISFSTMINLMIS
jgi:hypothetical protein